MAPTRRRYVAAAVGTLALAGCQGDGDASGTSTAAPTAEHTTPEGGGGTAPIVRVAEHPEYGDVLVDADGMVLYMFDSDTKGSGESTCTDDCLEAWPPLTVAGEATAGDAVQASLTTFERGDGETQVAANGWPLYYYASDAEPGEATGQGVGDVWWVLDPAGEPIRSGAATETPTATSDGGIGGY